jgi:hypothetical protein
MGLVGSALTAAVGVRPDATSSPAALSSAEKRDCLLFSVSETSSSGHGN